MSELRAVIYGVGDVGQMIARALLERGARITGAIDLKNVGRDLGEVIGRERPLGVEISSDADAVLASAKADIAIHAVAEDAAASYPHIAQCVRAGLNVLSFEEILFYPWRAEPELAAQIDSLAKENKVTVTAGGFQDVFWLWPALVLSGAGHTITSIEGVMLSNADQWPEALEHYHVGSQPEHFDPDFEEMAKHDRCYTVVFEALADQLGLTITGYDSEVLPIIATTPVGSSVLGRMVQAGEVIGASRISRVSTAEGVTFAGDQRVKVLGEDEYEADRWVIEGSPRLQLEHRDPQGEAISTALVNRVPDVIAAPPGLVTVDQLPRPMWRRRL